MTAPTPNDLNLSPGPAEPPEWLDYSPGMTVEPSFPDDLSDGHSSSKESLLELARKLQDLKDIEARIKADKARLTSLIRSHMGDKKSQKVGVYRLTQVSYNKSKVDPKVWKDVCLENPAYYDIDQKYKHARESVSEIVEISYVKLVVEG